MSTAVGKLTNLDKCVDRMVLENTFFYGAELQQSLAEFLNFPTVRGFIVTGEILHFPQTNLPPQIRFCRISF